MKVDVFLMNRNNQLEMAMQILLCINVNKQAVTKDKDEFSMHAATNNCHLNFDNNDLETAISIQHYHYNFKACLFNTQRK